MNNLRLGSLFVDFISEREVTATLDDNPWAVKTFITPPYSIIKPTATQLFTLGSGCLTSMATVSPFGIVYNSGIDIFRTDFNSKNPNEPLINIDHYIASPIAGSIYAVYKDPTITYHWPTINDPVIKNIPDSWKYTVEGLLKQKIGYDR